MRKKFFITTTVARTLFFFKGQPRKWKEHFDVCAIAAEKDKLEAFAEQEGIRYKYMPMHREISLVSDVICLFRFIWLFIKEHPYIVHGNTPKASMLSMFAAWLTRRPVRIYMCHGLRYESSQGFMRKVLEAMEWISCHCATTVIGVSHGVVDKLVVDGLCPKGKAMVVGYGTAGGIDINRFSRASIEGLPNMREELEIPQDAFVFCFVGRIVRDKGVNELVQAFDRLSQKYYSAYLLLVGPQENDLDPIEEHTKVLLKKNEHILAIGRKEDVRPYLAISNAFVLPSYREGLGQVLLEANAMDVPCIASDIVGPQNVIVPRVNGELVEARNAEALYEKMREWIDHPTVVELMSFQCRGLILERYSSDVVRDEYCKVYRELVGY